MPRGRPQSRLLRRPWGACRHHAGRLAGHLAGRLARRQRVPPASATAAHRHHLHTQAAGGQVQPTCAQARPRPHAHRPAGRLLHSAHMSPSQTPPPWCAGPSTPARSWACGGPWCRCSTPAASRWTGSASGGPWLWAQPGAGPCCRHAALQLGCVLPPWRPLPVHRASGSGHSIVTFPAEASAAQAGPVQYDADILLPAGVQGSTLQAKLQDAISSGVFAVGALLCSACSHLQLLTARTSRHLRRCRHRCRPCPLRRNARLTRSEPELGSRLCG